jgi:hypothetical protein
LADALRSKHDVVLTGVEPSQPFPPNVALLQSLERRLYRRRGADASDICETSAFTGSSLVGKPAADRHDLVIDLSAGLSAANEGLRVIAPLYDGVADELAAADALLDRRLIDLAIYDSARGAGAPHGLSASEDRNILSTGLDNVFCRAASLILRYIGELPPQSGDAPTPPPRKNISRRGSELAFLATSVAAKASSLISKLSGRGNDWSIAWRRTNGRTLAEEPIGATLTFNRHPNNPGSYFADPFLFSRDGRLYLFVEEFLWASNKGVISLIPIGGNGTLGPSRVVLERPYHLSYPFVFERAGEIYMIPETGAAGRVELYRADRFPDTWSLQAVLIDNLAACDATLYERDGRLWLFMSTFEWQSSSWDTLEIYSADGLQGPWAPMPNNPVLIDPTGARPAGHMFENAGALLRPAQDCARIYGGKLALCRVDELSNESFRQTIVSLLAPAPGSELSGVHTYNVAAGFEVVDIYGVASEKAALLTLESPAGSPA